MPGYQRTEHRRIQQRRIEQRIEQNEEYLCFYADCLRWKPGRGLSSRAGLRNHFDMNHPDREIPGGDWLPSPRPSRYNYLRIQDRSVCFICHTVHQAIYGETCTIYRIGTATTISLPRCIAHEPFFRENLAGLHLLDPEEMLYIMGTKSSTVFSVGTIDMICSSENESKAAQHRVIREATPMIRMDTRHVDMNILRGWLQRCDNSHGDHCQSPRAVERVPNDRPMWLVDVQRGCLVSSQPTDRYFALSYVWGQVNMFQALKSNIEELQRDNALKTDLFPIPCVVRDVFGLVILLNERYLWVDCLCIVQDDEETKMAQINNMASIYANSYATIVVADGKDANHGLRGIEGVSQSRKVTRKSVGLDDRFKLLQNHHSRLKRSVWWSRGWTLQEFVFSQRAIIFHDDIVSWECHCTVWDEDMETCQAWDKFPGMSSESAPCQERYSDQARGLQFSPWPNLDQYMHLVCAYNSRQLTFAGDILAAFKGVTNVLSRTFEGGFLCGLPEMFFDVALLWQPQRPLKRRAGLPSWSWVGWEGKIDQDSWRCGYDYVKSDGLMSDRQTSWNVFSILEWRTKSTMDEDGRAIINSSRKYRDKFLNSDEDHLPSGWSRHYENQYRSSRTYRHDSDEKSEFSYPIPILDQTEKPEISPTTLLLCCRTRRAWFRIGPTILRNPHSHHECSSVALKDPAGTWAGVLRLNKTYSSLFTFFLDSDAEGQPCELIAISRGVASNGKDESYFLDEWTAPERPKCITRYDSPYEFYNVLWIEWKDGIAYRKALGRVVKEAWDRQASEWIDITLG